MNNFDLKQSRQILSQGVLAHALISKLKVLIYGFNSLAVELTKNLMLSNVQHIEIYDQDLKLNKSDLCSNYFAMEEDLVNKRNRISCITRLKELNPDSNLIEFTQPTNEENLENFNIIIICELFFKEEIVKINNICRKKNIAFIYSFSIGLFSGIFIDYGLQFEIKHIFKKLNKGLIKMSHEPEKEEFFYQKEEGETELDIGSQIKLSNIQKKQSVICTITRIDDEILLLEHQSDDKNADLLLEIKSYGGYYEEILRSEFLEFQSFEDFCEKIPPKKLMKKFDDQSPVSAKEMFISLLTIMNFYQINNRLPNKLDHNDANMCKNHFITLASQYDFKTNDFYFVENFPLFSKTDFLPLNSIFGSIICQEALKCIGSHRPIYQFLFYESYGFLRDKKINHVVKEDSIYSNLMCLFGEDFLNSLKKERPVIIGSGAIGCELLKNLSMIGVGSMNEIIIIDPDNIELSNLCRQFLFRGDDIKKNKAKVASKKVKEFHPEVKITAYPCYLNKENRDIFNDEFWKKSSVFFSAVDNFSTRKLINSLSLKYEKPFFESATEGLQCNMEVIIPKLTSGYSGASGDSALNNEETTSCTEKYFILNGRQCISSALNIFKKYFEQYPFECNKKIEKFKEKKEFECFIDLNCLFLLETVAFPSINKLIMLALKIFYDLFYFKIKVDISVYPDNHMTDGKKTWSFPRRFPQIIEFDSSNDFHMRFIISLIELIVNMKINADIDLKIDEIKKQIIMMEKELKILKILEKAEEDILNLNKSPVFLEKMFDALRETNLFVKNFDKDDELDIEFVFLTSNIIACNYDISFTEKHDVHQIAGNVIPAVITSTSLICGLVSMEYIKFLFTAPSTKYLRNAACLMDDICRYKLDYLNEIRYLGSVYKPLAKFQSNKSENRNEWDKIIIEGPFICQDLINYLEKTYDIELLRVFVYDLKIYDFDAFEELEVPEKTSRFYKGYLKEKQIKDAYKSQMNEFYQASLEQIFLNRLEEGNILLKLKGVQKNGFKLRNLFYTLKK